MLDALPTILFGVLAAMAIGSALVVVGQPNPTRSAFALIVTLCSLSGIFALLGSPFIAALQVVVYAGAIMVLFLFVIMLLNVKEEERDRGGRWGLAAAGVLLGTALFVEVASVLASARLGPGTQRVDFSTHAMALVLFSNRYFYAFEATSILILAALVGAVVLAKREA